MHLLFNQRANGTIEHMILAAKQGKITIEKILMKFLAMQLYIICDDKVLAEEEIILPLCTKIKGAKYICLYTKKAWAEKNASSEVSIVALEAKKCLK